MQKGIKKFFRKFEFCAKVLSLFVENCGHFAHFNSKKYGLMPSTEKQVKQRGSTAGKREK
jgi:hypothetical protein